jgi:nucleotidyltransferase/DNA polymerase involved in DNA repair
MPTFPLRQRHDPLYCCLVFDRFCGQVIARRDPLYRDTPFVVVRQQAQSHKTTVVACSPAAREMGISEGLPVHACVKRFPNLAVVQRNQELEEIVRQEIAAVLYAYTP